MTPNVDSHHDKQEASSSSSTNLNTTTTTTTTSTSTNTSTTTNTNSKTMNNNMNPNLNMNMNMSEFSYVHSAVRTPPPPGFSVDDKASFYGFNRDGAGSAPPRSLISEGLSDGLASLLENGLNSGSTSASGSGSGRSGGNNGGNNGRGSFSGSHNGHHNSNGYSFSNFGDDSNYDHLRMMLRPSPKGVVSGAGSVGSVGSVGSRNTNRNRNTHINNMTAENCGRSSSFSNLAAALGEGLAESMGNSLVESSGKELMPRLPEEPDQAKPKDDTTQVGVAVSGVNVNNKNGQNENRGVAQVPVQVDNMGMDNFARQSRHSLSRLVGSSAGLAGVHPMANNGAVNVASSSSASARNNNSTSMDNRLPYSSQSQSHSQSHTQSRSGLRTANIDGNVVTVVEPSTPSPAPQQIRMNMNFGQGDFGHTNVNVNGIEMNMNSTFSSHFGRSSAPPQVFDGNDNSHSSHLFTSINNSAALRQHTATSLQRRAAELRNLQLQKKVETTTTTVATAPSPSHTPVPSFSNAPSRYSVQRPPSASTSSVSPHPHDTETESEHELRSFIWSANQNHRSSHGNFSSNNTNISPSRALAIFGVSQLPISEVRSTCEAFGSLLYFRSEFCASKNVIFAAYHDLRSACHASKELKTYLQRIASSNLNEMESITCRDALKVLYSVSLTASSEQDDSALLFSNVPYGVDKEKFTQMMTSFGAVQSVDKQNLAGDNSNSSGICFGVSFYDVQDASHCILEMKSTMPWGPIVSIKAQMRAENERKRGQDFLSLISNWRLSTRTAPSNVTGMQNTMTNNIVTERRVSAASTPSTSSLSQTIPSEENSRQIRNSSIASTESTTPPIAFTPQAPQLVVGPDGQYSYVIVQPHAYQTSPSQYPQPTAVLPNPITASHQGHSIPAPQYVFDGQNYWLQPPVREQHPPPNAHVPTYHQVANPSVAAYPVMPVYPMANPPTDSSLSSGSSQNHQNHNYAANVPLAEARKENNDKTNSNNQRNHLDLEAVEKGWDIRTSLMIRNIPNKYTRSMLLSEFKECGHGPGKIDFFYLPIDFRNKCNRGYAFVNFVDYRDIVSFYHVYNGKGWKTFKSDKICEISYARIQGKTSMLKRFQNSALMDKDPEYRPVIFNRDGEICSPDDENIS